MQTPDARLSMLGTSRFTAVIMGLALVIGAAGCGGDEPEIPVVEPLELKTVVPAQGLVFGNIQVIAAGSNIREGARVEVQGRDAEILELVPPSAVIFVLPTGEAGAADVTIINPDGQESTLEAGFEYLAAPEGERISLSTAVPTRGSTEGQEPVTLFGAGFEEGMTVKFGAIDALGVEVLSEGILVATTPPQGVGQAIITIENSAGDQAALAEPFIYDLPREDEDNKSLTITTLIPGEGPSNGGTQAAIVGRGFDEALEVSFAGAAASEVDILSPFVAVAITPPGEPGAVTVTLTRPGVDPASLAQGFRYLDNQLALTSVTPERGPVLGGNEVVVVGKGFGEGITVRFGDALGENLDLISSTALKVTVPAGEEGSVDVTIESPTEGPLVLEGGYTYVDESVEDPPLTIASVTPDVGAVEGGEPVVIAGTGFAGGVAVRFGGIEAQLIRQLSDEVVIVETPRGDAGLTRVEVEDTEGEVVGLDGGYRYQEGVVLRVTALSRVVPNAGPAAGGTPVAIQGSGLSRVREVRVGGALASNVEVVGGALILATTPAGVPGAADIEALLDDDSVTALSNAFFYFDDGVEAPAPQAFRLQPSAGPLAGGTPFVLSSANTSGDTLVFFGGRSAEVVAINQGGRTFLTGRTPAGAASGAVDVVVMNPDGRSATLRGAFAYYEPVDETGPRIDGVTPPTATTLGGTQVALNGDNFQEGVFVLVDGAPVLDTTFASPTRVTFTALAHPPGAVTVTAVNPDGRFFDLDGGLTYVAEAPTIAELLPSEGPVTGFSGLTIRGVGFHPDALVSLDDAPAIDTLVLDANTILAITPPGEVGPADVAVINPGDLQAVLEGGFTYLEGGFDERAPQIHAILPGRGPSLGGTVAHIVGENLRPGAIVGFGGVNAVRVNVIDGSTATVVTPAHAPGTVDLIWLAADGQLAVLRDSFTFHDDPGLNPTLGGLSPNRGPEEGGTPVVIAGRGFSEDAVVFYGDVPARESAVLGEGFISTLTPTGVPGAVPVTITNNDGRSTTLDEAFTYVPSPQILGLQPAFGSVDGGTLVQIGGRNFQGGAVVLIGGVTAIDIRIQGESLITALTPPALPGRVDVVVRNPDGQQATLPEGFEYLVQPAVESIWPESGPTEGGTRAILTGRTFREGIEVFVGDERATDVRVVSDTTLTLIVPPGLIGAADILVRNPDSQEATLPEGYLYVDPNELGDPPSVTNCFPSVGQTEGGSSVRVSGTAFAPSARAFFDGLPSQTGFVDTTRLAARTPAHDPAQVRVEVTNADGQTGGRDNCFEYTDQLGEEPPPLVAAVQPGEGPTSGGAEVVVTGDHFQDNALVLIGGRLASSINFESPTRLTATTPPGSIGSADVTVTNPDGKVGFLPDAYLYLAPPRVTAVDPSEGPSDGGTAITVTGSGFQPGAALRIGGALADNIEFVSETEIQAETPPGAPGTADVTVVNRDGQLGTLPAGFVYTPPPVVERIEPTSGSTLGDTEVRIFGSGFRARATVEFGTTSASEVQVLSPGELRVVTPAHPAGQVAVTVTNVDGFSDTLPGAFTYVSPPRIDNAAPNSGPEAGGTGVTILGAFFDPSARVFFGTDESTEVTFRNSSLIEAVSPARSSGPAAIRVRNPDGQEATLPGGFIYFPPTPPPVVQAISPNFGPVIGGTLSSVTGDDFQVGLRVFIGDNEVPAQHVTVISERQARIRLPPGDEPDTVAVRVLNPDGQEDSLDTGFTYLAALSLPPLALNSITPNRSDIEGGTLATVLGNGMSSDIQFFALKDDIQVEIPIVRYFSPTGIQVEFPEVPEPGDYDLMAVIPSQQVTLTLAEAIDYRDFNLQLGDRRSRLPNEIRNFDIAPLLTDLNNDGFLDVFIVRGEYNAVLLQNRGEAQPAFFDDVTDANLSGEVEYHRHDSNHTPLSADFNQDGFQDVISLTNRSDFRMWESEGHGRLRYGRTIGRPSGAGTIYDWVVVDYDQKDGLDMHVCTSGVNYWLRNLGIERDDNGDAILDEDGRPSWLGFAVVSFEAVVQGASVFPSEDSRGCDVGDVNGDGAPDVVLANAFNIANRLYISSGGDDPEFIDVSNSPQFQFGGDSRSARFIDFDHDGHLDIVMANLGQDDFMLTNDGAGNFTNLSSRLCHDEACRLADSEDPFFSPTVLIDVGGGRFGRMAPSQETLDLNRDGCVDLMGHFDGAPWLPRFYLQQKIGDAPQGCTGQFFFAPTDDTPGLALRGLFSGGTGDTSRGVFDGNARAMIGDLDNDGELDMLQVFSGNQNRIYLRRPVEVDGETHKQLIDLTHEGIVPRDVGLTRRAFAVDVNRDGSLDIILANTGGCGTTDENTRNRLYLNDGAGNFFDASSRLPVDRDATQDMIVADLSGDGFEDIITVNYQERSCGGTRNGQMRYYQNDGEGFFEDLTGLSNLGGHFNYRYAPREVIAVDVDGDDDLDVLVVGSELGQRKLYINGGDPLNVGAPFFFDRTGNLPGEVGDGATVLDFDGDGDQDVYIARNGQNALWENDGEGVFSNVSNIFIQAVSDESRFAIAGYFADSERQDLFVVNRNRKRIHIAQPNNTFSDLSDSNIRFSDNVDSNHGISADIDMDGLPDIIMPAHSARNLFYLNTGNAVFQNFTEDVMPTLTENSYGIALGDFDNDGDLDAFIANYGTQNRVLFNRIIE